MHKVSSRLRGHYSETFAKYGPNSAGVDWGDDRLKAALRYKNMLAVIKPEQPKKPKLLDVGCGYGGLLQYAHQEGIALDYLGIDVSQNMVDWANDNLGHDACFTVGDVLEIEQEQAFDYVVCNGILTQKLDIPRQEMDEFAKRLIHKMFNLSEVGVAFNIMTDKVNFFSDKLYYRNPSELLSWCMTELTAHIRLDHSYPLYEFTVYLYQSAR